MNSYDQQVDEQINNTNGIMESTFEDLKVVTLDNQNKPLKKQNKSKIGKQQSDQLFESHQN